MQLTYMNDTLANSISSFTKDSNLNPDSFIVFEDVSNAEIIKMDRLKLLNEKPYRTETENSELVQLLIDLRPYMPTSEDWNKFCASLYSTQIYMRDNIVVFINQKQQEIITFVNGKEAEMTTFTNTKKQEVTDMVNNYAFVGTWVGTTSYKVGNMVLYNGFGFTSKVVNNLNHIPNVNVDSDTYWLKFTIKGDKGDTGLNVYYKGEYSATKTYNLSTGDACSYNGIIYYVKAEGVLGVVPTTTTKWQSITKQSINVITQANEGATRESGSFYFVLK